VALRRVLDRDQVIAHPADEPELGNGFAGIVEQAALERRIGPRLGDDPRAIVRADFGLERLDDEVERSGIDVAFFGEHRLHRAHAKLHLGEFRAVFVVVVIVIVRHGGNLARTCRRHNVIFWWNSQATGGSAFNRPRPRR
jgi:hypothetical protein